ncbi:MAG: hypothetical protein JWP43_1553 [Ramlibacter sp.]|jgi:hypothetical protein|nr:hypothetical protein [Ramlibacter sp.]
MKPSTPSADWPLRLATCAILVLGAAGVMIWHGKEDIPPAKAQGPQQRRSADVVETAAPEGTAAISRSPTVGSTAPVTLQPTDPFTAFVEASKSNPGLLLASQTPVPNTEQMPPEAFRQALEQAKPPPPLPITSPFGSPN